MTSGRPDTSSADSNAGAPGRDETETERLDRNWTEILQELRVTQTGTQILTGFLLTLAFQSRFAHLDPFQVDVYLFLVVVAVLTTALALAPVSAHRTLFREGAKKQIVFIGNRILKATLIGVALVLIGTLLLIFDVVLGRVAGFLAGGGALVVIVVFWLVVPIRAHTEERRRS